MKPANKAPLPLWVFRVVSLIRLFSAICYSSFFIYAVMFARRRRHQTERLLNWMPVRNSVRDFRNLHPTGHAEVLNYYMNLFGNVLLYIPLPIFLFSFHWVRHSRKALFSCFMISLGTEVLQYLFCRGVADIDDIILNMTGALLGVLITRKFVSRWEGKIFNAPSTNQ